MQPFPDPDDAMKEIHEFHRLCERREQTGAVTLTEARRLLVLRDRFEPRHSTVHGTFRTSVQLQTRFAAIVDGAGMHRFAEVTRLSLREVEIVTSTSLSRGDYIELSIQRTRSTVPLHFRGRVIATHLDRVIVLLSPLRLHVVTEVRGMTSCSDPQADGKDGDAGRVPLPHRSASPSANTTRARDSGNRLAHRRRARAWQWAVAAVLIAALSLAGLHLLVRERSGSQAPLSSAADAKSMHRATPVRTASAERLRRGVSSSLPN